LRVKLGKNEVTEKQYRDACVSLLNDAKPKLIRVPKELFFSTYEVEKWFSKIEIKTSSY
jgi:hypothetical protein